jgi:hypothetical protein
MNQAVSRPLLARIRWYWVCQFGGWGMLGVADMFNYWNMLDRPGIIAVCWTSMATGLLLSVLWRRALHRMGWRQSRPRWAMLALPLLSLSLAQALLVAGAFAWFQPFGPLQGVDWLYPAVAF